MSDMMEQGPAMGGGELDEETMQLIAQLLQEGYTEDEIVEAIVSAEGGEGDEEGEPVPKGDMEFLDDMDKLKNFDEDDEDDEDEEEPEEAPPPKSKKKKKKKDDDGYAKGGYVKPAKKNNLAAFIGSLGRFG
jgi:hypothetical protein